MRIVEKGVVKRDTPYYRKPCDIITLRLNINCTSNKHGNRLPGLLRGILRRFKRFGCKDSPHVLRRSCGLVWAVYPLFHCADDILIHTLTGNACCGL